MIINGASSSVGAYAIQLAKRAGLFVIGIAGASKDYAKSLGADVVLDYREHKGDDLVDLTFHCKHLVFSSFYQVVAIVEAARGHPISHAFDGVTANGSTLLLAKAIAQASPDKKGKVTYVLMLSDEETKQLPPGVTAERTGVHTAYGEDWECGFRYFLTAMFGRLIIWTSNSVAARWYRQIGRWLEASESNPVPFKTNRVRILPGGLAAVQGGLALLKNGQVHAEKLVYLIADTPQLK